MSGSLGVGSDQSWTPLWSMIINSTLWGESKEVKILFVTMLAMKDCYGMVTSTTAGLARAAVLSYEETVEALKVLESPDTKSDTKQEHEGRRIKRVPGGWVILNAEKYKMMIAKISRRAYQKNWQKERRMIKHAIENGLIIDPSELSPAGWKRYQREMELYKFRMNSGTPLPGESAYDAACRSGDEERMQKTEASA